MKSLKAEDVTFTVEVEQEYTPVRGNYMATDDDAADKAAEDEILERLNNDDHLAWCTVVVKAHWNGFTGQECLGECSFAVGAGQKEVEEFAEEYNMKAEALNNLNETLDNLDSKLALLR